MRTAGERLLVGLALVGLMLAVVRLSGSDNREARQGRTFPPREVMRETHGSEAGLASPVSYSTRGMDPRHLGTTGDKTDFGEAVVAPRATQVFADFSKTFAQNDVVSTTADGGTTALSVPVGMATISSGVVANAFAQLQSAQTTNYLPGREIYAMFTAMFTTPTNANSDQRGGLFDATNGFFVGYHGTGFGITSRNNTADTFVAQASFNVDTLTGAQGSQFQSAGVPVSLDPTKYNVYRIRFGWLGAATIMYEALSPDGVWVTFHRILRPNSATSPSATYADLPVTMQVQKTTSDATNLIITTSSWGAGITGELSPLQNTVIDTGNSTTTALGGSATFTGTWFDVGGYSSISIMSFADQAGTLNVEFSPDTTNADVIVAYSTAVNVAFHQLFAPQGRYFRIVYNNGSSAQGTFRLQAIEKAAAVVDPLTPQKVFRAGPSCTNKTNFNTTADIQLVTGASGKQTYICDLDVVCTGAAVNVGLVEGTNNMCDGGVPAGLWGVYGTGSVPLANGQGATPHWDLNNSTATVGQNVCWMQSTASATCSGGIYWTQF